MEKSKTKRRSTCIHCGKRLSAITSTGDVRWKPSHVDDKGLCCEDCFATKGAAKSRKPAHPAK